MIKQATTLLLTLGILTSCGAPSGPGPLDGTWNISSITCNGQAGDTTPDTGAGSSITGGKTRSFVLNNIIGTEVLSTATCTVTYDVTLTYPSTNQINLAYPGTTPTCSPSNCDATLCATPKSGVAVYDYTMNSLSTATWTSGFNTDLTCTGATPFQDNPVVYTLTME